MSAYLGAVSIIDKSGVGLRMQERTKGPAFDTHRPRFRAARDNGWHCGHWHHTPEDAVACAIAKGAPS